MSKAQYNDNEEINAATPILTHDGVGDVSCLQQNGSIPGRKRTHEELEKISKSLNLAGDDAFTQIFDRQYPLKYFKLGKKVYVVAIAVVDRTDVMIRFKETKISDFTAQA
ncbi:MAG: hypothetical protein LBQ79_09860 [Deltaproteobacteria bacterium]|jgi:hypothetical protein|nr:hypothetical protein [Deltaproteobacteria bacterium]